MKKTWIIGIDEVGRGPLAGPVYVCGCAMTESDYKKMKRQGLNDSKKMTEGSREKWSQYAIDLKNKNKLRFVVESQSAKSIDKIGINNAISRCITKIMQKLDIDAKDCKVLLDGGLKAPSRYLKQQTIIKGDQTKKIISLASVIAKVSRDALMVKLNKKYRGYSWDMNKGYGTKAHREAIISIGITPEHRISYLSRILDK